MPDSLGRRCGFQVGDLGDDSAITFGLFMLEAQRFATLLRGISSAVLCMDPFGGSIRVAPFKEPPYGFVDLSIHMDISVE